jgi:hypothetical protein
LNSVLPRINPSRHRIIKIKNSVFAMPAAPEAIPVNPNMAATIAITRKIADHLNMTFIFRVIAFELKNCVPKGRNAVNG